MFNLLLQFAIEKLYKNLEVPLDFQGDYVSRENQTDLHIAMREALVNALIHADYANGGNIRVFRLRDQIVFQNDGTLRISKSDFFRGYRSEPRNHFIEGIFRYIGLCERAGSGIPSIMNAVKKYRLAFPKLDVQPQSLALSIWDISYVDSLVDVSAEEKLVLAFLQRVGMASRSDLEKVLEADKFATLNVLKKLISEGHIESVGAGKSTKYRMFIDDDFADYNIISILESFLEELKK